MGQTRIGFPDPPESKGTKTMTSAMRTLPLMPHPLAKPLPYPGSVDFAEDSFEPEIARPRMGPTPASPRKAAEKRLRAGLEGRLRNLDSRFRSLRLSCGSKSLLERADVCRAMDVFYGRRQALEWELATIPDRRGSNWSEVRYSIDRTWDDLVRAFEDFRRLLREDAA